VPYTKDEVQIPIGMTQANLKYLCNLGNFMGISSFSYFIKKELIARSLLITLELIGKISMEL
jgi:hypothetical protein